MAGAKPISAFRPVQIWGESKPRWLSEVDLGRARAATLSSSKIHPPSPPPALHCCSVHGRSVVDLCRLHQHWRHQCQHGVWRQSCLRLRLIGTHSWSIPSYLRPLLWVWPFRWTILWDIRKPIPPQTQSQSSPSHFRILKQVQKFQLRERHWNGTSLKK